MTLAVPPERMYAVRREHLRQQKELLRERLYSPADRQLRERTLREIALRAGRL